MTQERQQIGLGIVGFGEIGHGIGAGLKAEGLANVSAYDRSAFDGPFSDLKQARAKAAGVTLVESAAALAEAADHIVVAVPATGCEAAVEAILPHLGSRHLYLDLVSTTPAVKLRQADRLRTSGAKLADGGIMSSPLHDGHRIIIKASGPAAESFRDRLVPWGMRIEVVSARLGAATAIKILRSVAMKGLEALLHECAVGSERYGIRDEVLETIAAFMDARPFAETAKFLIRSGIIHAGRRAGEAAMAAEALIEAGVDPIMTEATVERLASVAELGLKERFGGIVPDDWHEAVTAVDRALKAKDGK